MFTIAIRFNLASIRRFGNALFNPLGHDADRWNLPSRSRLARPLVNLEHEILFLGWIRRRGRRAATDSPTALVTLLHANCFSAN